MALTLSSYTAKIGDTLNVSGILYPAKTATITLEYTRPNGTVITKAVSSSSSGVFADVLQVDQAGKWTAIAGWTGDDVYKEAKSAPATILVVKIPSSLTITASSPVVNVDESTTISGKLTPKQTTTITLAYTMPNGTTTTKDVVTNSDGTFTDILELDKAGLWQIKASWTGNEQNEAAESALLTIMAQTTADQAGQGADQTTPTIATAGLGLALIALILALAGIYFTFKKKEGKPAPAPTSEQPPTPQTPQGPTSI